MEKDNERHLIKKFRRRRRYKIYYLGMLVIVVVQPFLMPDFWDIIYLIPQRLQIGSAILFYICYILTIIMLALSVRCPRCGYDFETRHHIPHKCPNCGLKSYYD